jgi:hypothetical protein
MIGAVKRAWFLRYAALQFVVLTAIAMRFYADGDHGHRAEGNRIRLDAVHRVRDW